MLLLIVSPRPAPSLTQRRTKTPSSTVKRVETPAVVANPLKDPGSVLSKRSIYFDYDSASVKEDDKPLVSAHAKFLTDNR